MKKEANEATKELVKDIFTDTPDNKVGSDNFAHYALTNMGGNEIRTNKLSVLSWPEILRMLE